MIVLASLPWDFAQGWKLEMLAQLGNNKPSGVSISGENGNGSI